MTTPKTRGTGTHTRAGAARTLEAILVRRAHADGQLDALFAKNPQWTQRDRSFVYEMVYGVLRHLGPIDQSLAAMSNRPLTALDPLVLQALRLGAYQVAHMDRVPPHSAVFETVEALKLLGHGRAAPFANALLRRLLRPPTSGVQKSPKEGGGPTQDPLEALAVAHSHPLWLVERWASQWGPAALENLLMANNTRRPSTIHVVESRTSVEELCRFFQAYHGIEATPRPLPGCVSLAKWPPFSQCPAFQKGHYFVQDEGAQLVTALASTTGGPVLDACAAPGGKAALLWDRGVAPENLWVWDVAPARVAQMEGNFKRLGLKPHRVGCGDVVEGVAGHNFAVVVLDAPCTGLGVVGRHPEIRWNRTPADVATCAAEQYRLLLGLAPGVGPGGHLVYAVCSLEPEETVHHLAPFLEANPDFELLPLQERLPTHYHGYIQSGSYLQLLPGNKDNLDGFFACVLGRRGQ